MTHNDLITAHSTFNIYSLMLRVYKTYNFEFNDPKVVSNKVTFSSRPGDLNSKDDFYITDSNFTVVESSLNNWNKSNYNYLHTDSIPCWIRVNVANRLATSAEQWADIYSYYRSGTHNNQWFVVDNNAYR